MRVICFGSHPDDCEIRFGGTAAKLARQGHQVKFVSVTDGSAGHHVHDRATLRSIRQAEAEEAARRLGIAQTEVLANPDGYLTPSPELRDEIIRRIRAWQADMVLTHRPWDYHPDHRYTSQAVQDSAYLVMVPRVCADAPALTHNPVFLWLEDAFRLPAPFTPDIAVEVDSVWELKIAAMDAHASQFYEWLPRVGGFSEAVPREAAARKLWLGSQYGRPLSEYMSAALARRYGAQAAAGIRQAEAFQICEYGHPVSREELNRMMPL